MKPTNPVIRSDIHGVRVDVEVDDREVYGWLAEYLNPFITRSEKPAVVRFIFRVHPDHPMEVPDDAEWFLHYHGLAGLTADNIFYFRALGSVLRFDPETHVVEGSITAELLEHRRYLTHLVFTVVLFETLRYHGLYYIHGAALVSPEGERLLIPANASSGKTTLCVALLHHGYSYVSDDAVFARWRDSVLELVPFIREFHASPRLWRVFSELRFLENEPEYFTGNDKRVFVGEEIYPNRALASMELPHVIIFPEIVDEAESVLAPMTSHQALTRMIPNSALVMFSHAFGVAKSHLQALREIVCSGSCYELKSGRDVYDDPVEATARILKQVNLKEESDA